MLSSDTVVLVPPATLLERQLRSRGGAGPAYLRDTNMSMSDFAAQLGKVLGRPVVDATHLSGGYDFKLIFRPINDAAVATAKGFRKTDAEIDSRPSIFEAVREQLGLRLHSAKVPVKVLVVDSINRQPTPN